MNLSFAHPWLLSTVLERKYSAPMVLFNVCQISGPVLRLSLSTQQAAAQNIWRTKAVFVWFALHLLWLLCLFPSNICATSEKPVIVGKTPVSHRPFQKAFDGEYLPQEFFFSFSLTRFIFFSHLPCKKKKKKPRHFLLLHFSENVYKFYASVCTIYVHFSLSELAILSSCSRANFAFHNHNDK